MISAASNQLLSTLFLLTLALGGCQESKGDGGSKEESPTRSPDRGDEVDAKTALNDLFKNEIEFTVSELTGGKTNCDDITSRSNLASEIRPWPKELRGFLVDLLDAMPITQQVVDSVFAIYLVDEDTLAGSSGGIPAAGLACDRGTDYKGIIFLNYDTFVTDRKGGVGKWQNLRSIQEGHILLESGDNAAMTLVHEVLHAIDNKLYVNGLDGKARAGRSAVFDLSWTEHTQPRFERIDLMSLTSDETSEAGISNALLRSGCGTRLRGEPEPQIGFALTGNQSGKELAADLRYLADKTNFIVPYAMVTAAEDFAESLTIYYFGTYLNSWQTRSVYTPDISKGVGDNAPIYVHKTSSILKQNANQKAKMCQMAELVFASCKL